MDTRYFCPVCESWVAGFLAKGTPPKPGVKCPVCKSNGRIRYAWVFLRRNTDLFDGRRKSLLHFAPEPALLKPMERIPGLDYLTADLDPSRAMVRVDITDIQFEGNRFDALYCSHVLEHVPDDRRAIRELLRVLKPGGWALFMVPIKRDRTYEDPGITDPAERERIFGQHDHVRAYGPDFLDRLTEAGFHARAMRPQDVLETEEAEMFGVQNSPSMVIFFATKPR